MKCLKDNKKSLLIHGSIILSFIIYIVCIEIFSDHINFTYPQLIIDIESSPPTNEFQVYYDIGYGFREKDSVVYDVKPKGMVSFRLPAQKSFRQFRIDPGNIIIPFDVRIRSITLITEKKKYSWKAKEIAAQFIPLKDIDTFEEKDGVLLIHATSSDPQFISPSLWFSTVQRIQLPDITTDINANIESVNQKETVLIKGWAFLKGQSTDNSNIYLVLHSGNKTYTFDTLPQIRLDVTQQFHNGFDLNNSGFIAHVRKSDIPPDRYQIEIFIRSKTRVALINTHKILDIKYKENI